jgi:signal peptidase I
LRILSDRRARHAQKSVGTAPGAVEARRKSKLRENVESLAVAVLLFLVVRTFLVQAFRIPSESMERTLLEGDFLFVNKFLYGAKVPGFGWQLPAVREIRRGDVVVFKNPLDRKTDYIKRCVAVAGDTLVVRDNRVYINGGLQTEKYVNLSPNPYGLQGDANFGPYVVPEGHFFAMGDNRRNSSDSRAFKRKGAPESAVPLDLVVGKAMFIYFSADPSNYYLPRFARLFRPVR